MSSRTKKADMGVTKWVGNKHVLRHPEYSWRIEGAQMGGQPSLKEAYEHLCQLDGPEKAAMFIVMAEVGAFMVANGWVGGELRSSKCKSGQQLRRR